MLDKAHAALTRGDFTTALRELLVVWATRKTAALGDAIDEVGRAAAARIDPPTGKTPKDRKTAWLAMARKQDPALTSVLLAHVTERLITDAWDRFKRLDLADPRVVQRIADVVETAPYNPDTHPLIWKAMFTALMASEDPRIVKRVRGFDKKWSAKRDLSMFRAERLKERRAGILPVLEKRAYATATSEETKACTALVAAIPSRATVAGEDDLLAAIYEDPADDAPRMVYMDWLLQNEDPRGELLQLQLGQRNLKREEKLVKQFEAKWLGAIRTRIKPKTARWERGFLAQCALLEPHFAIDTDPKWATVHTLVGGVPGSDRCNATGLRALLDLDRRAILQLAKLKKPLAVETLAWSGPESWTKVRGAFFQEDGNAGLDALEKVTVLPKLRRLELQGHAWHEDAEDQIQRVLRAPCAQNLEELAFPSGYHVLEDWLTLLEPTHVKRVEVRDMSGPMWRTSWQAHFERGPKGKFSRLRFVASYAHYASAMQHYMFGHEMGVALEHLDPTRLDSVEIQASSSISTDCRRQMKKPLESLKRHERVEAKPIVYV